MCGHEECGEAERQRPHLVQVVVTDPIWQRRCWFTSRKNTQIPSQVAPRSGITKTSRMASQTQQNHYHPSHHHREREELTRLRPLNAGEASQCEPKLGGIKAPNQKQRWSSISAPVFVVTRGSEQIKSDGRHQPSSCWSSREWRRQ